MESYNETRTERYSYKARELEETGSNVLEAKMAELHKIKEDLEQAKDDAMQTWLDSRPLIDELERLQTGLESAKSRFTISNIVISEVESQLETTNICIRSKKEEELKVRTMVDEITRASDKTREELEQLKLEIDEERRARSKLKQVLRLRRQTLRTLQLSLRAIRLESEAFGASAAEALHQISRSQTENSTVDLSQDDYYALTRRAEEETSLAEWRVSVSMEQRLAAEERRDLALNRLKEQYSDNRSRKKKMEDEIIGDGSIVREAQEDSRIRLGAQVNSRQSASPKARAKLIPAAETNQRYPRQQFKRSKSNNNKKLVKKKKPSILVQVRTFLVQRIKRLFR